MVKALNGIRVVDFSWIIAGPMTTKMLGAMGAEIIKIESSFRPEHTARGGSFPVLNANKRSCSIDISRAEGQALVRRLVGISNLVVENFSARVLAKHRLAYADLRAVRPDLIFVSASGVGRSGPQKDWLAYGTLLQAYSGRAGLIGEPNLKLEAMGILPVWTDLVTAYWETTAILAALYHWRRTGIGGYLDLSMLESTVALLPEVLLREGMSGGGTGPAGNDEPDAAPGGCFRCAGDDAWLALSVRSDAEFAGFCAAVGQEHLTDDIRFRQPGLRLQQKSALNELAGTWLRNRDAADAEATLLSHGVPAARTRRFSEVMDDPLTQCRGIFPVLAEGKPNIALPWRTEDGWRGDMTPAPELGQDNDYVFGELLGIGRSGIDELISSGVIR